MKRINYIFDYFLNQIHGGAELVDNEIINELIKKGFDVKSINSRDIKKADLECELIISNFIELSENTKKFIQNNCEYSIIEHDHKYIINRDPSPYINYIVPSENIINKQFYKKARAVFGQSKKHCEIISKNLGLNNVINLSTSIWSLEHLDILEKNVNNKKEDVLSILDSKNPIKNSKLSQLYCQKKNINYKLIPSGDFAFVMELISKSKKFMFFPQIFETFNRLVVEARMLNCELMTNPSKLGCVSEEWFRKYKGKELINFLRNSREDFINKIINKNHFFKKEIPKVSIITSLYKGEDNISGFLENITSQSCFGNCELIIINANSPEKEDDVILPYLKRFSNIKYEKLEKDPGIYATWNLAIERSTGKYLTNANLDDRRIDTNIYLFVDYLENNPDIDLVYGECLITKNSNETYEKNSSSNKKYPTYEFTKENMIKCLPGCMPVWRRSMHDRAGLFNENYKYAGDWEMWLRSVRSGAIFKKIPGTYGLYHFNPNGLSTSKKNEKSKFLEEKIIFNEYRDVIGEKNYQNYKGYFNNGE